MGRESPRGIIEESEEDVIKILCKGRKCNDEEKSHMVKGRSISGREGAIGSVKGSGAKGIRKRPEVNMVPDFITQMVKDLSLLEFGARSAIWKLPIVF